MEGILCFCYKQDKWQMDAYKFELLNCKHRLPFSFESHVGNASFFKGHKKTCFKQKKKLASPLFSYVANISRHLFGHLF